MKISRQVAITLQKQINTAQTKLIGKLDSSRKIIQHDIPLRSEACSNRKRIGNLRAGERACESSCKRSDERSAPRVKSQTKNSRR